MTGRWPLLLRLVSKILADYARVAADVSAQGAVLLERLRAGGPAVVDDLLGEAAAGSMWASPRSGRGRCGRRSGPVPACWTQDAERFAELGVFAEDETIPFGLVARLWRATAGLDDLQAAQVATGWPSSPWCHRPPARRGITVHDVVRDFLRAELGQQRLADLNGMLLDAVAADLPAAEPARSCCLGTRCGWPGGN